MDGVHTCNETSNEANVFGSDSFASNSKKKSIHFTLPPHVTSVAVIVGNVAAGRRERVGCG